jgi:hypothetical protein
MQELISWKNYEIMTNKNTLEERKRQRNRQTAIAIDHNGEIPLVVRTSSD